MKTVKEKNTVLAEVNKKLDNVEAKLMDFTNSKLVIMDKKYKLREWMTLSDYYKKYNIKPSRLSNWIDQGIIPDGNILLAPN